MPTKDCLVDLSEPPFFLLDTNELEIAYFERVSHNLKYFDMVFVCKDYETWVRIDAIPTKKLENVKTWIDSINVRRLQPRLSCSSCVLRQARFCLRAYRAVRCMAIRCLAAAGPVLRGRGRAEMERRAAGSTLRP